MAGGERQPDVAVRGPAAVVVAPAQEVADVGTDLRVVLDVVGDDAARAHLDHPGGHRVDELAVVRNEEQRAGELLERQLQRFDRLHVEVVGGFVEHQYVVAAEHQPPETHAVLLAAGEHAHRLAHLVTRKQQAPEHAAHRLAVVAGPGVAGDPPGERVVAVEVGVYVLRQDADVGVLRPPERAARGRQAAERPGRKATRQRRLARAAGADDRHLVAPASTIVEKPLKTGRDASS